ncbi:MAG: hypothetical protein ACK5QX_00420 [bacterium]
MKKRSPAKRTVSKKSTKESIEGESAKIKRPAKAKAPAKRPAKAKAKRRPSKRIRSNRFLRLKAPLELLHTSRLFKNTNTIHKIYHGTLTPENLDRLQAENKGEGKSWLWFEYVDKETGELKRASSIVSDEFSLSMSDLRDKAARYKMAKVTNVGFQLILPGDSENAPSDDEGEGE